MGSRGFPASGEKTKGHKAPTRRILSSDGALYHLSFPLPKGYWGVDSDGVEREWHPRTIKWWEALRRSPQARMFNTELDWEWLLDVAVMHHSYYCEPTPAKYTALKAGLKPLGATPEDRARGHMDVEYEADMTVGEVGATAANVTDFAEAAEAAEAKKQARLEREAARKAQQG